MSYSVSFGMARKVNLVADLRRLFRIGSRFRGSYILLTFLMRVDDVFCCVSAFLAAIPLMMIDHFFHAMALMLKFMPLNGRSLMRTV